MSRPLKCSKLSEAREHENIDRISSLPDELLVDILSILPTKCAVATSVLSSRWKCLHMFTNCLSFDVPYVMGRKATTAQRKSFKTFVNKVLLSHKMSPIKKFHLNCYQHNYAKSQLHNWIGVALSKRVEQLHLYLGYGPLKALPDCLFNCETIVELKIDTTIQELHVPKEIHLPNLKILYFERVFFVDYDSLSRFFSACPCLQDLALMNFRCSNDTDHHVRVSLGELKRFTIRIAHGWFEIDSPKLVYLDISCSQRAHIVLSLKNPERLVAAHVNFEGIRENKDLQHALVLLQTIHYVKELHLEPVFDLRVSGSEDFHLPSYPNLVKLSLGYWPSNGWKYVRHLLGNSPQLETVIFNEGINMGDERGESAPFSCCVKVIEVSQFYGDTEELFFLKHLLANADKLNLLILKQWIVAEKQTLEVRKKLLKFPRASKTCDIQVKKVIKRTV